MMASKDPASIWRHAGAHSAGSGKAMSFGTRQHPRNVPPTTPSPLGAVTPLVSAHSISGK